ncbi:hypothetical protein VIOR3934_10405 [Vibrio orientalis CIP 102891 = ATCC 33934]|uniref:Glutathione-dependent thiol reductase n=1 Tax=Vibrio orientalis CIP 102891 = ATCC 33934 TaxID=675816 RepID=C9QJC9_VIBOR|nr:ArsC family reductase [Vibrio orientalis]EEX91677.1 glutathione-dependent thiol reductase [Vibrio orientalis CIP 102891 = ATCC 33934]EGU45140.1 hypothetical protein VIOR3934_10405 [Vibrio orientalis CIP 102891 = ATCC 33934]
MTITMYGIPNCDTIKKAKKWLEAEGVEYSFHDYRKQGIDKALVETFCQQLGWENVLNKRGTTYRQLTQEQKDSLNEANAIELLVEQPAMIKRPILVSGDSYHLGFKADQYTAIFS